MKSKRILALMSTLLVGATAFSGCGGKQTGTSEKDPTKANLTVATYDGGVGKAWLEDAARRFEKLHENSTHFQEGRTGVAIDLDADKVNYGGTNLKEKTLTRDVYFTEGVEYYAYVDRDKVADLTDVVKASMSDYGETGTIEDKMDGAFKNYLTARDGKYYMLPFYDGFYGFIYDIDLFEEAGFYFDQYGDFIGLDKGASDTERAEFEEAKSNGPDGKAGTYDDGLPATYAQMIELADEIASKGYVPFCYSGQVTDYVDKAIRSFISDYEGYDAMLLNYTLNGKATVVDTIANGVVTKTKEVTITPSNAYELQKQAGKYYALSMEEQLFGTAKYVGGTYNAMEFTEAQRTFIYSKYAATRYAMLIEGVWWENEADVTFAEIETQRGEKKSDRRFGFLPMPKQNESLVGTNQTMLSLNSSYGFINKNAKNMELAKEFMRFLHSDSEMSKFSAKTSIPRSLNYSVAVEDRDNATSFGKTLIDMRSNAKVVYPYSSQQLILDNSSAFTESKWFSTALVNGNEYSLLFDTFSQGKATAEQYFNGMYTYHENAWKKLNK